VLDLYAASDGYIWVSSTTGIYNDSSCHIKSECIYGPPGIENKLAGKRVNMFMEDAKGNMWMSAH
jgi:ligand-binding sensor domain-containing protein